MSWGGTLTLRKLLIGFNLSLLLILLLSMVLPVILLGSDVFVYFHNNTLGIMLLSFIAINAYFAYNWTLFCSLEKGNWYALLRLLRSKIFEKKQYKKIYIFYFIEVAIQLNNLQLLRELFEELHTEAKLLDKPLHSTQAYSRPIGWAKGWKNRKDHRLALCARKRLCEYAIELGLPYLIDDPGYDSEVYFGNLREFHTFQQQRYIHKYKWAELFYAIALLIQGKLKFAARLLEKLLLPQQVGNTSAGKNRACWFSHLKVRERLRGEDALLQLVSIQLLEDLQEHVKQQSEDFSVDQQLIDLRRAEIQKIYESPKHWSAYLLKEQNQNIAIVMIRQLIRSAYEQQLRPVHQAYLAGLETRSKAAKHNANQYIGN